MTQTLERRTRRGAHRARPGRSTLDRTLRLLETRRLDPLELRVLLALSDHERTIPELADRLDRSTADAARAAERLYARGLIRWRHDRRTGATVLEISRSGLAAVRPLTS